MLVNVPAVAQADGLTTWLVLSNALSGTVPERSVRGRPKSVYVNWSNRPAQ